MSYNRLARSIRDPLPSVGVTDEGVADERIPSNPSNPSNPSKMPQVHFTKEGKVVECEEGAKLRDVAVANDVELYPGLKKYLNCHGFGQCGECRVHVTEGMENLSKKGLIEKLRIAVSWFKIGHEDKVRLACQCRVQGDVEVQTQPEFNWFGERAK